MRAVTGQIKLIRFLCRSRGFGNKWLLARHLQQLEQSKAILRRAPPMKAAIVHVRLCPFEIAAGIEKIAVLQAATNENDVIKNEALIVQILVLVDPYFASHGSKSSFRDNAKMDLGYLGG